MNHNEEMKLLTLMGDISKSLKKIADCMERAEKEKKEPEKHDCSTCAYETASEINNGVEYDPCYDCYRRSKWKPRRSCT